CKRRQTRRPCSSSGCTVARRNLQMKTRRCVWLYFRSDHTSATSANLGPAHRRNPFRGEPARPKLLQRPDQKCTASRHQAPAAHTCLKDAARAGQERGDGNQNSDKEERNVHGAI